MIELKSKIEHKYWRVLNELHQLLETQISARADEIAETVNCSRADLDHIIRNKLVINISKSNNHPSYIWNSDIKPNIHMLDRLVANIRYKKREWNQQVQRNKKVLYGEKSSPTIQLPIPELKEESTEITALFHQDKIDYNDLMRRIHTLRRITNSNIDVTINESKMSDDCNITLKIDKKLPQEDVIIFLQF